MNLGQTMITMGMFILLVMSVISANRMILENAEMNLKTEALTGAATAAQNLMGEAMGKSFDANSDNTGWQDTTAFTYPGSLGPNSTESYYVGSVDSSYIDGYTSFKSKTYYSDFDDYNGYKRIATANNISGFVMNCTVFYVTPWDPEKPSNRRTFYKVMRIIVTHSLYIDTPLEFTTLLSY